MGEADEVEGMEIELGKRGRYKRENPDNIKSEQSEDINKKRRKVEDWDNPPVVRQESTGWDNDNA